MSKMSELHMELTVQANEMGFDTLEDALGCGYEVDYENHKLVDPYDEAHKAWAQEKAAVIHELVDLRKAMSRENMSEWATIITHAIEFIHGIKRGEF